MQDTSFAIHPGNKKNQTKTSYQDVGSFIEMKKGDSQYSFRCEHGYVNLIFYRDDIVRIVMNPKQEPNMEGTFAIVIKPNQVETSLEESESSIIIANKILQVKIDKYPFRVSFFNADGSSIVEEKEVGMGYKDTNEIICYKSMDDSDHFYGFGEKTGFLDKRGEKLIMWNTDVYAPHNPETNALYQSIPFFMTLRNGRAHGLFFDNSYKSFFDLKSSGEVYSYLAEGGQLDYYLMAGPTPKSVLSQYTEITGRMSLPPKWALGYHQSRYSYETEEEVRELAATFIEKRIPLDAIYLDIHYMDGYRVFTFDKERFPKPKVLIEDLKNVGIHTIPIVDPGVKEDPEYSIYREGVLEDNFCKYLEDNIYYGDVWPGNSAFPDFFNQKVRKWWGEKHRFYTDCGIEGIWNDMNEPAVFNETKTMDLKVIHNKEGELHTHRELHNLYGLMMGEATYEGMKGLLDGKRPFLLTRAGYAGVQRYSAVWTGDNRSFWEHLAMSIPMVLNLGVSGVAFAGPDVGGFAHDASGELLTRWTQVGAFTPYFRNHSAMDTVRQEPWAFGQPYEDIIKKYIELRYQWLPHFYNLFVETTKTGLSVMRPLFMEYPEDSNTFNLSDQFMIGDNVIIAPILKPDTYHRVVYLPVGSWYDYWTDKLYVGGTHVLVEAPIDTLPIFVRAGTQLLHGSIRQSTMDKEYEMNIHLYLQDGAGAAFTLYDDDGESFSYKEGNYLEKRISHKLKNNRLEIEIEDKNSGYKPTWGLKFIAHYSKPIEAIIINGIELSKDKLVENKQKAIVSFVI